MLTKKRKNSYENSRNAKQKKQRSTAYFQSVQERSRKEREGESCGQLRKVPIDAFKKMGEGGGVDDKRRILRSTPFRHTHSHRLLVLVR